MIAKTLTFLRQELNEYLLRRTAEENKLYLSHLVHEDGKSKIPENSLGLTMVNVEEERHLKAQRPQKIGYPGEDISRINPEIKLNLFVLIASNFANYEESLKFIGYVISFFQTKNVFTPQNSTGLDPALGKIIVDLYSLPMEQLNYLWGAVGAKYLPSVLYKIRMIVVQEQQVMDTKPAVKQINISHHDQ